MKNILKWRLKEQPTTESLLVLVKDGLLSKDEAREILFSSQTEEDRDKKSLESEIKFLRELVQTLSSGSTTRLIEVMREVEKPWRQYPWYNPYLTWSTSSSADSITMTADMSTDNIVLATGAGISTTNTAFADIKTF